GRREWRRRWGWQRWQDGPWRQRGADDARVDGDEFLVFAVVVTEVQIRHTRATPLLDQPGHDARNAAGPFAPLHERQHIEPDFRSRRTVDRHPADPPEGV